MTSPILPIISHINSRSTSGLPGHQQGGIVIQTKTYDKGGCASAGERAKGSSPLLLDGGSGGAAAGAVREVGRVNPASPPRLNQIWQLSINRCPSP